GPRFFFFQAEDGIRGFHVTGVQTCALPISGRGLSELRDQAVERRTVLRDERLYGRGWLRTGQGGTDRRPMDRRRGRENRHRGDRSEERRVGKEWKAGGSQEQQERKTREGVI